ncbi:hypothetical protein [Pedococcus sp. 5OH_020]|uniref:hypothetical protein n=1 Tax=Pedococcus sp. 5OH_020 TaxID=2989814 RepID=UPI0022E9A9DE|nr:hypothetical protein [Pedococcus sp. 5OH_020]
MIGGPTLERLPLELQPPGLTQAPPLRGQVVDVDRLREQRGQRSHCGPQPVGSHPVVVVVQYGPHALLGA